MNNPVNWFEIATEDLERAKDFYVAVFSRNMQYIDMPDAQMYMFEGAPDASGSLGAIVKSSQNTPSADGAIIYFSCEDLNNELEKVEAAGGKVLFPKMSIGEFGFISQFIDSEGNRIGLHSHQ